MSKESDIAAAAVLREWADRAVQQEPTNAFGAPKRPDGQICALRTAADRAEDHALADATKKPDSE